MFTVRAGLALAAVSAAVIAVVTTWSPRPADAARLFAGDYGTGDFSQWQTVQTKSYNSGGKEYVPDYSASIVPDTKGYAARYEVRAGDVPDFGGGERAEVQTDVPATGGLEGQTSWYRFSTKFDPTFPMDHADLGWGVTNQWHADSSAGSPPVSWTVGRRNGFWSLTIDKQSLPGAYLETFSIFDTPLAPGQWHDVTMQVHWSESDDEGWIRLWHNGVRQTFVNGADTYAVRTLIPGTTTVYYKEGMYRAPMAPTDIVYHTGFRSGDSAEALSGV